MSPLAIAGMNNTPEGSRTLGEFLHLCRLLTLLLFFFLSSGKKNGPFVCGLLHRSCLHCLEAKEA